MKNLILITFLLFSVGLSAQGGTKTDTLITSSSVDTLRWYISTGGLSTTAAAGQVFTDPMWLDAQITTDSLTGGTTGTFALQECNVPSGTTPTERDWTTVASGGTLTINGATRQRLHYFSATAGSARYRGLFLAPSSTQTTLCTLAVRVKKL